MKKFNLVLILITCIFFSCEKKVVCESSMELRATPTSRPTVGDDVLLIAGVNNTNSNAIYTWNGPAFNADITQTNQKTISQIKLSESGIYSCVQANNGDCNPVSDTIFIDVQLKQETPPCTPANNNVTSASLPTINFSSVTQSYGGTFNTVTLYASPSSFGVPSFTTLFNSYNGNVEPRDGTHITAEGPSFSITQEPNEISISFIYNSNYYHCVKGKNVYVSHVNGKLRVTFCNLQFSSPPFGTITASGMITEL